jgi:hypothetical protein
MVLVLHWQRSERNDNEGLSFGFHGFVDIWNK